MILKCFSTLLFCLVLFSSEAQSTDSLYQKLNELITAYEQVYGFSGAVKVVQDEKPVFEQSFGYADRSFSVKNTPDTRFSINSISKTFTATAVLILVEEGRIDLQAPISRYLPYLTAGWKDTVTTHQLLSHTSGLPRESGVQWYDELSLQEQALLVDQQALLFAPGARYEYSNSGVILLGAILESASGREYADFIQNKIIAPLGLPHTGVYTGRGVVKNQAVPYRLTANGLEFAQRTKHYGENAGGGLYSTPSDLYRYIRALEEGKLLPKKHVELLFTPHVQSGEGEYEGYAWSIKQFGDETLYFAAGSGYGTKSVIIRSPEHGGFIGITSNWGNTPILQLLGDLFLLTKGREVELPSSNHLAKPGSYREYLGVYTFDREVLQKHLMMDRSALKLQAFEGKLFLDDELLAEKGEGRLGLTYTDELIIEFEAGRMIITINDNRLISE